MSLMLACTWRPRGEVERVARLRPLLDAVYDGILVCATMESDPAEVAAMRERAGVETFVASGRFWGRYEVLQKAVEGGADRVQYVDLDRLVRWAALHPDEVRLAAERTATADCLVVGRSPSAFAAHPQALQQTERIVNEVFSYLLGRAMDFGAGCRGYSRRGLDVILANSQPGGYGDSAWPVLVHRAGLRIDYLELDGLDWETPDHHRDAPVDAGTARRVAAAYDHDAERWAMRVRAALEITREGLEAARRPLAA